MLKSRFIIPALFAIIFSSCQKELLKEEFNNTPVGNFDALWSEYDRSYGAFEAKGINWDSLYQVYRPQLNDQSSNEQLYNVLTGLLGQLEDGHVQLTASNFHKFYSSGIRTLYPDTRYYENPKVLNTLFAVDRNVYLKSINSNDNFFWTYIKSTITNKKIGYLYVPTFSYNLFKWDLVDQALESFKTADAVIIDLRFNGGGATESFVKLLNKLADKKRRYLRSKLRNGPNHSDYTEIYDHYYEPKYGVFEAKPLILLVNRFSGSSSEHFMLGIQSMPYGVVVGDTTYGALSVVLDKILPNGWAYRTCPQVLCDANGNFMRNAQGKYPDGIGLAPDVYIVNYYKDILNNKDYVLEKAIEVAEEKLNIQ